MFGNITSEILKFLHCAFLNNFNFYFIHVLIFILNDKNTIHVQVFDLIVQKLARILTNFYYA